MALQNIVKNRRFFVPYLLTITGTSAAFYIMCALCTDPGAQELEGYEYVQSMMMLGMIGEYVGRIYISINNAPTYVIKETTLVKDAEVK